MTRVVTATAGSVVAIIALIGAKAGMAGNNSGDVTTPAPVDQPLPTSQGPANQPHPNQPAPANPAPTTQPPANTSSTAPAPPAGGNDGTFTGSSVRTPYGPVQVEITVAGGKISDIRTVQCPTATPRDQMICQQAVPYLVNESIAAQSANVNAVSGATYTSEGYKQSLQSAIDQAGL